MEKTTEGMKPLKPEFSQAEAELIAMNLARKELEKKLAEEKIKTDALSRRCIALGKALEEYQDREHNREDAAIIDFVNGRCANNTALKETNRRYQFHAKKEAEAYERACTRNAYSLGLSAVIGFGAILFGFTGFIHAALAAIIAGISFMAFGWALNDCVYLLGRCE